MRTRWAGGRLACPLRRDRADAASATAVASIISLGVFTMGLMVLLSFAEDPVSTAKPDDAMLRAKATDALRILGGSPGVPAEWGASNATIQSLARLGLLETGTHRTLDTGKFDALARGRVASSAPDDRVDYTEALAALGLEKDQFHLRAFPVFQPFPHGSYGVEGMEEWRVAYVGHFDGNTESTESLRESAALDALPVAFDNVTHTGTSGDKYRDKSQDLRQKLVPLLGSLQEVTAVSGSLPNEQFRRLNETVLTDNAWPAPDEGRFVLAVGTREDGPSYVKGKDFRGVLGYANLSLLSSPRIAFREMVEGEGYNNSYEDCATTPCQWVVDAAFEDYGVVEASIDNGSTWVTLNPATSTDIGNMPSVYSPGGAAPGTQPDAWVTHTLDFSNCPECLDKQEVLLAVRWRADGDNTIGSSWLIDHFVVEDAVTGADVLNLSFESPYYSGLIIGSNVDQNAMTPQELKTAIRDFVMAGGKLFVMGGQQNVQWLQPLFKVGIAGSSGQAFVPDKTHPLITVPNKLDHARYDPKGAAWTFSQKNANDLFANVVQGGTGDEHVLAVSTPNAFGDGSVILTTWLPFEMSQEENRKWFANAIVYGKYHYLYMEVGPPVPPGVPVASASMTAVMDKTRDGSGQFIEMALVMYVWD